MTPDMSALIDALERNSGRHAGRRRAQARGVCATGVFTASGEASSLTSLAPFQSGPTPITARFSNSDGNPATPDYAPVAHGLSVKFHSDNGDYDIISVSLPSFLAATPADFIEAVDALRPDPATGAPDPERVVAYVAAHPTTAAAFAASQEPPPVSYATTRYRALHTFLWVAPDGRRTPVRYRWEPEAGVAALPGVDESLAPDYLTGELLRRLTGGTASFTLHAQIAGEEDDLDDPSVAWPEDRREIKVGRLVLDQAGPDEPALAFDPTRLIPGVELSGDPLLLFRKAAYAESYRRRRGED